MTFRFLLAFLLAIQSINLTPAFADISTLSLPAPNQMLQLSMPEHPVMLQGLQYDPTKPFQFGFIVEQGDHAMPLDQLRDESMGMVRYFMAAMTMPVEDLWVNLSPYEKNRIIPDGLEVTRLGSDMLAEDYILKQLSSSLTFPDSKTGRAFWQKIYKQAQSQLGNADVRVSTFNKVWIVPDFANVLIKDNTVLILDSHLKVMMEQDYLALKKGELIKQGSDHNEASKVMRQVIIPVLENEINTGAHFTKLRQMFHAVVLAEWYKRHLKNSLISQYYANQHKMIGINENDQKIKETIYQQYLSAYKKGVYNFIREDAVPGSDQIIPRKYFSGGIGLSSLNVGKKVHDKWGTPEFTSGDWRVWREESKKSILIQVGALPAASAAMSAKKVPQKEITGQEMLEYDDHGFIPSDDTSLTTGDVIEPLKGMQNRWVLPSSSWDEMNIINQLKFYNAGIWFRTIKIITPYGPQWIMMDRVQHYTGPNEEYPTGGGVRINTEYDLGNEPLSKSLFLRKAVQTSILLAQGMTQKQKAMEMPIGGAKGGIVFAAPTEHGWTVPQWTKPEALLNDKKAKERFMITENLASFWFGYYYTSDGIWKGPDMDRLAPDMYTGPDQMVYLTEGRLTALREMAIKLVQVGKYKEALQLFGWRDTYLKLLTPNNREGFIAPHLESYKPLLDVMLSTASTKESVAAGQAITEHPLLSAYLKFAHEHPGLPMPELAAVSGKPLNLGGHPLRPTATAVGLIHAANEFYRLEGQSYVGKTLAVQAFPGNVGGNSVYIGIENNYIVRGLNNIGAAVESTHLGGFTTPWLKALQVQLGYKSLKKVLENDPDFFANQDVKGLGQDALLSLPTDAFVAAAGQYYITTKNVNDIAAPLYIEGGNDTMTDEAEKIYSQRGTVLIDSIANAGGTLVSSYAEAQQWILGRPISVNEAKNEMFTRQTHALEKYYKMRNERNKTVKYSHKRVTLRNVLMADIVYDFTRQTMMAAINRNHGEINEMLAKFEPQRITEYQLLVSIKQLHLWDYLLQVQQKDLDNLLQSILKQLQAYGLLDRQEILKKAITDLFSVSPKAKNSGTILALARTFNHILRGDGEKVTTAARRLKYLKPDLETYPVDKVQQLRETLLSLLSKIPGALDRDNTFKENPAHRLYMTIRDRVLQLNDVPQGMRIPIIPFIRSKGPQDEQYKGWKASPAMKSSPDGGIDLSMNQTLINETGEAHYQSELNTSIDAAQLQQIKGLEPIFLRLEPVNIPELMGISP